ncbi:hypothetical protein [Neobacillus sp. YIM B06451]|nr:hypothetical protein [Neobacillus sp. YIM B06451]
MGARLFSAKVKQGTQPKFVIDEIGNYFETYGITAQIFTFFNLKPIL